MNSFTRMDAENKTSWSDTHVYFVAGPFSQWWRKHPFRARLSEAHEEQLFDNAEKFMMMSKALLFDDHETLEAMGRQNNPRLLKEMGRTVRGFRSEVWDEEARKIVYRGNFAKFSQHPELLTTLLQTGGRKIVEGAHYDRVWGVGLAWDDPAILDEDRWRGANWLGEILMRVRDSLSP